jgi:hypothetical protein
MSIDYSDTVGWPAPTPRVHFEPRQVSEHEARTAKETLAGLGVGGHRRPLRPLWQRALATRQGEK